TPLAEVVVNTLPQLRRGMTLAIVTGSTDREWVRALASLRRRGVGTVVVLLDRASFTTLPEDAAERAVAELAAVRHALTEYGIDHYLLRAGDELSEALGGRIPVMRERINA